MFQCANTQSDENHLPPVGTEWGPTHVQLKEYN